MIAERALRIARDILDLDEFRDLALPGGLAKRGRPDTTAVAPSREGKPSRQRKRRGEPPADPGALPSPRGRRIGYEEVPFETGSRLHSRFANGIVQVNTLHVDYQRAVVAPESRVAYAALMIGKESIAWNDRTGSAGDYLEKLLDFRFQAAGPPDARPAEGRRSDAAIAGLGMTEALKRGTTERAFWRAAPERSGASGPPRATA